MYVAERSAVLTGLFGPSPPVRPRAKRRKKAAGKRGKRDRPTIEMPTRAELDAADLNAELDDVLDRDP